MWGMSVTLRLNEISARSAKFAQNWHNSEREEAEPQMFLLDFFRVLGVERKRAAFFEQKMKCADGGKNRVVFFWKGHILIEMTGRGMDLHKAYEQAKSYVNSLPHHELPRAILVCDVENWHFYDLTQDSVLTSFTLAELPQYIHLFHYPAGYGRESYQEEDTVNVQAAELLGKLYDCFKAGGYDGYPQEVCLVRLLFCLFADDTGIFRKDAFRSFILQNSAEDGHDLASMLALLFQALNTPVKLRPGTLDAAIEEFPYINGGLFAEILPMPGFDAAMRRALLDCCSLDWSRISPAIFGSMFQCVVNPAHRRALGVHYTSERNILKLIKPLFLDDLRAEFERIQHDKSSQKSAKLAGFHQKLASLTFLDPACGCGNFLVVAYRELRRLELDVMKEIEASGTRWLFSVNDMCVVNVNQFYGIELEAFPAQIAQVAMWLMDHQMNIEVGSTFGEAYARIPLTASASIVCGNALQIDWETVVPKGKLSYIMGNPPFGGARNMSKQQKADLLAVFENVKNAGDLDYVAAWYGKAADYMIGTKIRAALVSTNSLCQGQSVAILWKYLMQQKNIHITFAYRTFKWRNEARGQAAVHCLMIGFCADVEKEYKLLFHSDGRAQRVSHINGYLVNAPDMFIENRNKPLCDVPGMVFGSMPNDGGHLIVDESQIEEFAETARDFVKPFLGAKEFIQGTKRWCLWLKNVPPSQYRHRENVMERINNTQIFRENSSREATRKLAQTPALFGEIRQPEQGYYLLVPLHSSENRLYIPIGFLSADIICSNANALIPNATLYHLGIITSTMHMAWTRAVCGRLKSDYRYSNKLVYNNYPWPDATDEQQVQIAELAQGVLDARALYPNRSLADLYDPQTMPIELLGAHHKLDAAVEKAYGRLFADDADRVAFLFEKYREKCRMN